MSEEALEARVNQLVRTLDAYSCAQMAATLKASTDYNTFVEEKANGIRLVVQEQLEALKRERDVEAASGEASREEQALKGQIEELRQSLSQLNTSYRSLRDKQERMREEQEAAAALAASQTPEGSAMAEALKDVEWRIENYERMLRMRIVHNGTRLRVIFTGIHPKVHEKEYFVEFELSGDVYDVVDKTCELDNLNLFLADADMTGNFPLLLRRIRQLFVQLAEGEVDGDQ